MKKIQIMFFLRWCAEYTFENKRIANKKYKK